MAITIEQIMEQAGVYASAWSMVGGPFDQGNQLQQAKVEKLFLQELLETFQTEHNAELKKIASGLLDWHLNKLENFDQILSSPPEVEIRLEGADGGEPIILSGPEAAGFRVAMLIAKSWIAKFPLSITYTSPTSDEEE